MDSPAASDMIFSLFTAFYIELKKSEKFFQKYLTNQKNCDIINIVVRAVMKALKKQVGV